MSQPERPPPGGRARTCRIAARVPLPFLLPLAALATGALSVGQHGVALSAPGTVDAAKAAALLAAAAASAVLIGVRSQGWRTLGYAGMAVSLSTALAHGLVRAMLVLGGGIEGLGPRGPLWLAVALVIGGVACGGGLVCLAVAFVDDLKAN